MQEESLGLSAGGKKRITGHLAMLSAFQVSWNGTWSLFYERIVGKTAADFAAGTASHRQCIQGMAVLLPDRR
jgi:hypothetical protein